MTVVQRILAPYRVEVFRRLGSRSGIELTILYGRGTREGQFQNATSFDGLRTVLLPTLATGARLSGREHYLTLHPTLLSHLHGLRSDVILAEGVTNILNNIPLTLFGRITGTPLVFWDPGRFPDQAMGLGRVLAEPVARWQLRSAAACVGYGESSIDYFERIRIPRERCFLAPNTVDFAPIVEEVAKWKHRTEELGLLAQKLGLAECKIALHIGSLHASKPLDPLIRACALMQRSGIAVALLVIGDGPDRIRLEALARTEGLKGVCFLGRITRDLGKYALMSKVAVFPGKATLGVLTALGFGLPVLVARNRSPEQEAVEDGTNGFLFDPADENGLKALLTRIIRDEVGFSTAAQIRESVYRRFSIERMVEGIAGALEFAVTRARAAERGLASAHD